MYQIICIKLYIFVLLEKYLHKGVSQETNIGRVYLLGNILLVNKLRSTLEIMQKLMNVHIYACAWLFVEERKNFPCFQQWRK